jgi:hypothetical protein
MLIGVVGSLRWTGDWTSFTHIRDVSFMLHVALVPSAGTTIRGASISWMCYLASAKMHSNGLTRALYAPMSFFDTTPLGAGHSSLPF